MTIAEKLQTIEAEGKRIDDVVEQCRQQWRDVSAPEETDLGKIPSYYRVYKRFFNGICPEYDEDSKLFVFAMFLMYSPASCVGRAEKGELRRKVADALGLSPASVSVKLSDARFYHKKMPSFRESVERLYHILQTPLEEYERQDREFEQYLARMKPRD